MTRPTLRIAKNGLGKFRIEVRQLIKHCDNYNGLVAFEESWGGHDHEEYSTLRDAELALEKIEKFWDNLILGSTWTPVKKRG